MIYTTGTIGISGNILTGAGTNFTAPGSLIRIGCTVLTMTSPPQVFQITGITSATAMTVSPAASPALAAGTKYSILLSDNLSVDGLAQGIAETFTMYQKNISGFADVMNGTGDVTITVDGKPVTVPGQKSLAKKGANSDITSLSGLTTALSVAQGGTGKTTEEEARKALSAAKSGKNSDITELAGLTTALSIAQGGTGATDAAGIRKNAGLGSSATKDAGTSAGNVMEVGAFGLGLINGPRINNLLTNTTGFYFADGTDLGEIKGVSQTPVTAASGLGVLQLGGNSTNYRCQLVTTDGNGGRLFIRSGTGGGVWNGFVEFYNTRNVTKASDGTLKAASPVIKLFNDGRYETNDESEGCAVEHIGVGEYLITGCMGLNSDAAWGGISGGFDIPKDRNGQPLVWLDFEVNADGSILVKTYHRTYPDAPKFAQNRIGSEDENGVFIETISEGEPIDIPADQFVSVRVEMPADSIWNQKQSAIQAQSPEE